MITNKVNNISFKHKILIDIGASNPKATAKVSVIKDNGQFILEDKKINLYVNDTPEGFKDNNDFLKKIYKLIKKISKIIASEQKKNPNLLSKEDAQLSGTGIFVPGTTFPKGENQNFICILPHLTDSNNRPLTNINFENFENRLTSKNSGIKTNKKGFRFIVMRDMVGTALSLAKIMAKKDMLKEGDFITGIMTGGGLGSFDIKVKNNIAEIETTEASNYLSGNNNIYENIIRLFDDIQNGEFLSSKELKKDNYKSLKDKIKILEKIGRQGVTVKSHIEVFCNELNRPDLIEPLQKAGDARIVELNKLHVNSNDFKTLKIIRKCGDDFVELGKTKDDKIVFELNKSKFGENNLKKARITAINKYAEAISLISINRINDCVNKIILIGTFVHGINDYIKSNPKEFNNAKDLPELVKDKILDTVDVKNLDLATTKRLMELHNFQVICDKDINFSDNTYCGGAVFSKDFQMTKNRSNWYNIPISSLKN